MKKAKMNIPELYRLENEFLRSLDTYEPSYAIKKLQEIIKNFDEITLQMIKEEKTTYNKYKILKELVDLETRTSGYIIHYLDNPEKTEKEIKERKRPKIASLSSFLKMIAEIMNYKEKRKASTCNQCGCLDAYVKEIHPDTDMNEIVKYCPKCKYEESL